MWNGSLSIQASHPENTRWGTKKSRVFKGSHCGTETWGVFSNRSCQLGVLGVCFLGIWGPCWSGVSITLLYNTQVRGDQSFTQTEIAQPCKPAKTIEAYTILCTFLKIWIMQTDEIIIVWLWKSCPRKFVRMERLHFKKVILEREGWLWREREKVNYEERDRRLIMNSY